MHEQEKLEEAGHFFSEMATSLDDPKLFKWKLSAFLAAARSVLQYALREAKKTPAGKAWYDAQVSANAVLKFFKDKRDISVHHKPVIPTTNKNISMTEHLHFSESWSVQVIDVDGKVISESKSSSPPPPPDVGPTVSVSTSYTFPDWPGSEDVVTLATKYLAALEVVVKDGIAKGHLPLPS